MNHVNVFLQSLLFSESKFRCQPKVCDGWHDLMQNALSFNDATIFSS